MKGIIHNKLKEQLAPSILEIVDQSHLHEGHAGARVGGESHFKVSIKSEKFDALKTLECHRIVNNILSEELKKQIHALTIKIIR